MTVGEANLDAQARRFDADLSLEHAAWSWLDGDGSPRLMVDGALRLSWSNRLADDVLASRQGLTLRNGILAATDPARQDALRAAIVGAGVSRSLCLARPDGDGWLLVDAARIAPLPAEIVGLTLAVVLESDRGHYRHLDEAFGLTRAEHRVLLGLLDGFEAEVLASRGHVTIDTTRSQIRSIYAKLGVKSREQMFARLQGFRARP